MFDWPLDADLWIKIAGFLTAVLGLLTALVTLQKTRSVAPAAAGPRSAADPQGAAAPRLRMLPLQGEPVKPWSTRGLKILLAVSGLPTLAMTLLAFSLFVSEPSFATSFLLLFFGALTSVYAWIGKRLWTNPTGSPVKRETKFDIQGDYDRIWDQCITALKRMNVDIKILDSKNGLIEGKIGWSWKSFGEIIAVHIIALGSDQCAVHAKSDSVIITTVFDWGKNAANIRRFLQELFA